MTQADRVFSTPPTNTSANNPTDPTRRHFLTIAAAGATALTVAPARAASPAIDPATIISAASNEGEKINTPVDPIYAAIERHKVFALKHAAAWNVRGRFNDCQMNDEQERQLKALEDAIDLAWEPCKAAGIDLINTSPTTRAGMVAAIRYIQAQHRDNGEHMPLGEFETDDGADRVDWLDCFLDTLIESVDALGKAVQS